MSVKVKRIKLWRSEVDNQPGALSRTLAPLTKAGADLQVVMGYRFPGNESRAAIEAYPVAGKKLIAAAREGGLSESAIPTLLVEGRDRPGLGQAIAAAMADAGVNMGFLVAQVIGKKFSATVGFDNDADARKAATLIRKAVARVKKEKKNKKNKNKKNA